MKKSFKHILINSTLAFVAAFIITTFIHEFSHFLSYIAFDAKPTLNHNFVQATAQHLSKNEKIFAALAGPIGSLIQGIVFWIFVSTQSKNKAHHLFLLWLSLLGFVNFFGYLVITPFSNAGDTGKVANLLQAASLYRFIIAIIGLASLIYLVSKIGKNFSRFIPSGLSRHIRSKYIYHLMFYPIIIGSLVNALLAFPLPALVSVIYPATSSFVIMSSFSSILGNSNPTSIKSEIEGKFSKPLIILTAMCIVMNRLLTLGIG